MIGEPKIQFGIAKADNNKKLGYRNVLALVAPFKDDSFKFKAYSNLDLALAEQITTEEDAIGYKHLKQLKKDRGDCEIILVNITTNTGTTTTPVYDYSFDNAKFADALAELDKVQYNVLDTPYQLTQNQLNIYEDFWTEQNNNMFAHDLLFPIDPLNPPANLEVVFEQFENGGLLPYITTAGSINHEEYSLEEMNTYIAGLIVSLPENISLTYFVLDGYTGQTTKEKYGETIYKKIINNGGLAIGYRERPNKVYQIVNGGTCTWNEKIKNTLDIKIQRIRNLIINELRIGIYNIVGDDNEVMSIDDFNMLVDNIKETYKLWIVDLVVKMTKTGSAKVQVEVADKQNNIIFDVNVIEDLIIL